MPSQYGINKPWHFFITDLLKKFKNNSTQGTSPSSIEKGKNNESFRDLSSEEIQFENEDVKAERYRVMENRYPPDSPLVLKRMRKEYSSGKLAVKDVTFAVEKDMIFGLLGPNGAGK